MAYCTQCGNQMSDAARFCSKCGAVMGSEAGPAAMPAAAFAADPLDYTIQGDNLQIARVRLKPGQEIFAEAGKMMYKTSSVNWDTRMGGQSLGDKLWGALKRKLAGESLFMTYFHASSPGEVGFAGNYPGRIQAYALPAGRSILVQRDAFLFAESTVQLSVALVKKLGAGFFGGEGFILERLTGPGTVFIHAGGDHVEFDLKPGEVVQVDTGCVVGFEETVDYDIQFVGGIKTAIFGGEGLFLTTLTGPGKVTLQSMTLAKLRSELSAGRTGGESRSGFDAISGILSSED